MLSQETAESSDSIYSNTLLEQRFFGLRAFLALFVYRSQAGTWLALLPAILLTGLTQRFEVMYAIKNEDAYTHLEAFMGGITRPLYEVYGRCTRHEWMQRVAELVDRPGVKYDI